MKIFLYGDIHSNTGPANVTKELAKNDIIISSKIKNKYLRQFENILNIFKSSTVVYSGFDRLSGFYIDLCKLFNKKTVYIMHGYVRYENEHNKLNYRDSYLKVEDKMLNKCNLILPVSKLYSLWFLDKRPEFNNKTFYLSNGIDISKFNLDIGNNNSNSLSLVATGGNRIMKNNNNVAKSVKLLNNMNFECSFTIYGRLYSNNEDLELSSNVKYGGLLSQEELYSVFRNSKLYILNTTVDSFGLSVIEALMCGCNVLVSKNAGVCSILKLEENDLINDVNDINELVKKIKFNLLNDNNKRILEKLDLNHYSWKNVSDRLIKICNCLENNIDFRSIK